MYSFLKLVVYKSSYLALKEMENETRWQVNIEDFISEVSEQVHSLNRF